jgi:hypothetical protein
VLQSFAVIATANHFIFDGVIGVVISVAALGVAVWLQRRAYPSIRDWFGRRSGLIASRDVAELVGPVRRGQQ